MDENEIAIDEFDGIYPSPLLDDFAESYIALGVVAADTGTVWIPGRLSSVASPAYRKAAAFLRIYRSRVDFLKQRRFESSNRTN